MAGRQSRRSFLARIVGFGAAGALAVVAKGAVAAPSQVRVTDCDGGRDRPGYGRGDRGNPGRGANCGDDRRPAKLPGMPGPRRCSDRDPYDQAGNGSSCGRGSR